MISAVQCRKYAAECQAMGMAADISIQRATILMAMATSWDALAQQTEWYEAIEKTETREAVTQEP
jgi:hypothetical protein